MTRTPRRVRIGAVTAAVTLLAGALAACSSKSGSDSKVSLRMTVWTADKSQLALFNSLATEYQKTHSNVTSIKFDVVPFDSYTTALTTQIAGSNPPDLAWILERDAPDFVSSGALTDLKPTFERTKGYDLNDLAPTATKLWLQDDKLFAYPFSTSPMAIFYNKDLLDKAGVTQTPDQLLTGGQWTWANAEQVAAQVAAKTKKAGLVVRDWDYKTWANLATIWRGFGADAWAPDANTCGFTSPQMAQAMTFLHDAIFKDHALPSPGTTADFFAGEAALTITQISRASLLKDHPFKWGIVPLPAGPAGAKQVIGQAGIGVLTKGKHAEQAADFLAFFTAPENSAKLAQYFPPARESQLTAATLAKASPMFTPQQLQRVVIDGIKTGSVLPSHKDSAKLETLVQSALDPMWKPDADVSAVLAGVCKAIDPTLSQ